MNGDDAQTANPSRDLAAFFSYVRADDEHDLGKLTELRRALAAEVSAQIGFDFLIFQDRADILWGQRWRQRIEESIDASTALVVVVTPRLLKSHYCLEEIERFVERERQLDRQDLIFPIYYIEVPGLADSDDPLVQELTQRQWADWRELRFDPLTSPDLRKRIATLAAQMVISLSKPVVAVGASGSHIESVPQDAPGFIELVAESEQAMPLFLQTLVDLSAEMDKLNEITTARAAQIERAKRLPKPTVAQLQIMREMAHDFEPSADRFEQLAADYTDQLERVDSGITALIERIPAATTQEDRQAAREFRDQLHTLEAQTVGSSSGIIGYRDALAQLRKQTSTLRPVLLRLERAVDVVIESIVTFKRWAERVDDAVTLMGVDDA